MGDPKSLVLQSLNKFLIVFLAASLYGVSLNWAQPPQRIHGAISDYSRFSLPGNVHPAIATAQDQGAVAGSKLLPRMTMHFSMTPSQNADLQQLLRLQQTRHSAQYHQWLTPEQYAERFGMNAKDIQSVSNWLESMGFADVEAARTRSFVSFSGTAAQVEGAFHTSIHNYLSANGTAHIANATALELPASLDGVVSSIRGLHDFHPKPHIRPHFTSNLSGDTFLTPDDFATIYDIQALYGSGITGTGRTIVIPGQTDIIMSDIEAFQTAAGLPVKDPTVVPVPSSPDPGTLISSGDLGESDLDLEWSGAIAKGATIVFVSSTDVFTSVGYAIDNNLGDVLPITYGACEAQFGASEMASVNSMFQTATAMGMTVIAASGDAGAADCDGGSTTTVTFATQGLGVDFPASSPYVTGMGGTEFNEGSGSYWNTTNDTYGGSAVSYIPETAWNDTSGVNGLSASGGGGSIVYQKPSWQTGTGVPSGNFRSVPDLALAASPGKSGVNNDGYLYCTNGWCTSGFRNSQSDLDVTGGTSADSPAFGAIVALLDQKMGTRQGNVNPNLYLLASIATANAGAFHDITSGSNIVPCQGGTANCSSTNAAVQGTLGFSAGPGYDQVTGLGSVDANNLFEIWNADFTIVPSPSTLSIAPGGSGTSTIKITPTGNFAGMVSFTCSLASTLANVTCAVPGTVSSGSGTVTLTVTAGANAATPFWHFGPHFPSAKSWTFYLIPGLLLGFCTLLSVKKQSKYKWAAAAFGLVLVAGLSSCGNGGTTPTTTSSTPSTPAESGLVTITATSGALANVTTVSVTVQ